MGRKSFLHILEEEQLCELIKKHKCIYDKTSADYKNQPAIENAWEKIDYELGWQEG